MKNYFFPKFIHRFVQFYATYSNMPVLIKNDNVVKSGQLKTGKKGRKSFVVVRQDGYNSPARIDCYPSLKHYQNGSKPSPSLRLSNLFSVNKTAISGKVLYGIAVYGPCRTLYLGCSTENEQDSWLACILRIHRHARSMLREDVEKRQFDFVWDVKLLRKGLAVKSTRLGGIIYRLCLDQHSVYLYKHCQQDEECLEFLLEHVSGFHLTTNKELVIRTSRSTVTGEGEIWLKYHSTSVSQLILRQLNRALLGGQSSLSASPASYDTVDFSTLTSAASNLEKSTERIQGQTALPPCSSLSEELDSIDEYVPSAPSESVNADGLSNAYPMEEVQSYVRIDPVATDQSERFDATDQPTRCVVIDESKRCVVIDQSKRSIGNRIDQSASNSFRSSIDKSEQAVAIDQSKRSVGDRLDQSANKASRSESCSALSLAPPSVASANHAFGQSTPSGLSSLIHKFTNVGLDLRRRAHSFGSWRKKMVRKHSDNRLTPFRSNSGNIHCRPRSDSFGAASQSSSTRYVSEDFVEIDFGALRPSVRPPAPKGTPPSVRYVERFFLRTPEEQRKDKRSNSLSSQYVLMDCASVLSENEDDLGSLSNYCTTTRPPEQPNLKSTEIESRRSHGSNDQDDYVFRSPSISVENQTMLNRNETRTSPENSRKAPSQSQLNLHRVDYPPSVEHYNTLHYSLKYCNKYSNNRLLSICDTAVPVLTAK